MFAYEFRFDDEEKNKFPEMYKLYRSKIINESFSFAEKKKSYNHNETRKKHSE